MSENEIYDLVIIGGGPGGLTAGIYAMRAALKTALIELGAPGGQMNNSDSVENWPGEEYIVGADLALKFSQHAQSYGLDLISQEAVELLPGLDVHTIKLASGDSLRAHAVILATGGSP
ncbi:MAG: FAD-dependent oxidoreductase, partial [Desulfobacterales bacterium]